VKPERQRLLATLLRARNVPSQARLLEMLREQGFEATQATVSRDLEDLGAVKVRGPDGQLVYALPDDEPPTNDTGEDTIRRILQLTLLDATPSGNLVVLRTPPAHAQLLADTLDRSGMPGLVGTVAGDDTVLAICDERTPGRAFARRLRALADPGEVVTHLRSRTGPVPEPSAGLDVGGGRPARSTGTRHNGQGGALAR
jgi:transcriptional regulator of arginine metabolism